MADPPLASLPLLPCVRKFQSTRCPFVVDSVVRGWMVGCRRTICACLSIGFISISVMLLLGIQIILYKWVSFAIIISIIIISILHWSKPQPRETGEGEQAAAAAWWLVANWLIHQQQHHSFTWMPIMQISERPTLLFLLCGWIIIKFANLEPEPEGSRARWADRPPLAPTTSQLGRDERHSLIFELNT